MEVSTHKYFRIYMEAMGREERKWRQYGIIFSTETPSVVLEHYNNSPDNQMESQPGFPCLRNRYRIKEIHSIDHVAFESKDKYSIPLGSFINPEI